MATRVAHLATDTPDRYLRQMRRHAQMFASRVGRPSRLHTAGAQASAALDVRVECTGGNATITFNPRGRCRLHAEGTQLVIRVDNDDEAGLRQITHIVTPDIARFSGGILRPVWTSIGGPDTLDHRRS
ncbi:DUF2218 domain-containing protein [Mycolicibacterium wolinskyi]|uniref:Uncharacterized protein n=1 Tax=Mycolicibacterium wolinskyi TaxID=59750 RepID=A0A1X2FBW3_9MYCO|nr:MULTISPECIES: DUF2218 domain-containing protein [Mycolicibacterium]MCV7283805.1 DUF2218 domain-containing protein [Mycolicibacterium wolinskyi]MCV7297239.1 DUF2218 domain-containing protein [Mycolicibacterium goodii]ORX15922.1 hypothetical protein AWC31_00600 [Mycolicibacterium wolinskyi]